MFYFFMDGMGADGRSNGSMRKIIAILFGFNGSFFDGFHFILNIGFRSREKKKFESLAIRENKSI